MNLIVHVAGFIAAGDNRNNPLYATDPILGACMYYT